MAPKALVERCSGPTPATVGRLQQEASPGRHTALSTMISLTQYLGREITLGDAETVAHDERGTGVPRRAP
jgi:hypothetical protein